ncbi:MAG TPA: alpha/beta hydrolase-fold protein, partial [Candidatus Eisenbacteria bacterium]|nr:alpha/beta hydrolase-fold protein [Candidatus Eisenbacteria bacterium]
MEAGTRAPSAAPTEPRRGHILFERFESRVLAGNPAGDPATRTIPLYLPPSYATEPNRRYPVIYVLSGFTGRGRMLLNDNAWSPALDERMNALIAHGCDETILVMPDCFTKFGGSQYLNSSATGPYEDHLISELVPWVDRHYRTFPQRGQRGIVGKSSGGYGALALGMRHADVFGAVGSHSGDMLFDYCYRGDVPEFCTTVRNAGGLEAWWRAFQAARQKRQADMDALNILGMAAAYSPNPATQPFGIDLPIDLDTGAWRDDVWQRWLAHDPLRMLDAHADALRSLQLLYLDAGTRDEWHLHLGLMQFTRALDRLGIAHHAEYFDDGHMNVPYRYDVSLPMMARALSAGGAPERP